MLNSTEHEILTPHKNFKISILRKNHADCD